MTATKVLHGLCIERRDGTDYRVYDLAPMPIIQAGTGAMAASADAAGRATNDVHPLTVAVALDVVPADLLPAWSSVRFRPDTDDAELGLQIRVELYEPACSADAGEIARVIRARVRERFLKGAGAGGARAEAG